MATESRFESIEFGNDTTIPSTTANNLAEKQFTDMSESRKDSHSPLSYESHYSVEQHKSNEPMRSITASPEVEVKPDSGDIPQPQAEVTVTMKPQSKTKLEQAGSRSGRGVHRISFDAYGTRLSQSLQLLLQEAYCTDVILSTGYKTQTIRAHRLILSAFSPYFKELFASLPSSGAFPIVLIRELSYETLCTIIDFCYRGEIYLHESKLKEFEEAACFLQISGVKEWNIEVTKNGVPALDSNHNQVTMESATRREEAGGARPPKSLIKRQKQLYSGRRDQLEHVSNGHHLETAFDSPNWSGSSETSADDISVSADEEGATTTSTNSSTIVSMASSGSRLAMANHGLTETSVKRSHNLPDDHGRKMMASINSMQSSPINLKLKNMSNSNHNGNASGLVVTPINNSIVTHQQSLLEPGEKRIYNLKRKILDREYNGEYDKMNQKMMETYSKYPQNGVELNGSPDRSQSVAFSPIGKKKAAVAAAAAAAAAAASSNGGSNNAGGGGGSMSEAATKLMSQMFNFPPTSLAAAQLHLPTHASNNSAFDTISAAAIARAALAANFNFSPSDIDDNLNQFNAAAAAAVADLHRQGDSPAGDDYLNVVGSEFAYNASNFFRAAASNGNGNGNECFIRMNENSNNASSQSENKKSRGRPTKNVPNESGQGCGNGNVNNHSGSSKNDNTAAALTIISNQANANGNRVSRRGRPSSVVPDESRGGDAATSRGVNSGGMSNTVNGSASTPSTAASASSTKVTKSEGKAHHQCPHCPQKYYGSHAMHDHIRSVHLNSVEKYYCPYCKKYYAWHQTLRKHLRDIHGISTESLNTKLMTSAPPTPPE